MTRFVYAGTVTRVIDADTVELSVDVGFRITHHLTARLLGINAPEMSTAAGVTARAALVSLVQGRTLEVRTVKDRNDKYGRMLATIMLDETQSVNDWLIEQGYAVPYLP